MKNFREDLVAMQDRLKGHRRFAFSRFGDGEMRILTGGPRNYPEFCFNPPDPAYVFLREKLLKSLRYRSETYFVGLPCPASVGKEQFLLAKTMSGQLESQLTWATLFVNANYRFYTDGVVPLFARYAVYLVCHKSGNIQGLPFALAGDFRIEKNAWRVNYNLGHQIKQFLTRKKIRGALFLLCAGPLANILAHQLHEHAPENTYIDVGSTLDPFLLGSQGFTRKYLRGESRFLTRVCTWH